MLSSTTEICSIGEAVVQATYRLASVNAKITGLREQLDVALTEHNRVTGFLRAHKALLSPVRRIPPEVLSEIFISCLPEDIVRPTPKKAPLLVSQICSMWRSIALATPSFWSSIDIRTSDLSHSRSQATGMRAWLARSGACPLFLSLREDFESTEISECLGVAILYLPRCRELTIGLHPKPFTFIPRMTLPMLKCVNIQNQDPAASVTGSLLHPFADAPLRSVGLHWYRDLHRDFLRFPWSEIRSLKLENILSAPECLGVLRSCPTLTTCWLDLKVTGRESLLTGVSECQVVKLPKLQSLTIHMMNDNGPVVDYLVAPVLRTLSLSQEFYSTPTSSIVNMLAPSRSGCHLEALDLTITGDYLLRLLDFHWQEMLQCMPSLMDLTILVRGCNCFHCSDRVFTSLTCRRTNDGALLCLVPKLRVLNITIYSDDIASDDVVKTMLLSRLTPSLVDDDPTLRTSCVAPSLETATILFPSSHRWFITDSGAVVSEVLPFGMLFGT